MAFSFRDCPLAIRSAFTLVEMLLVLALTTVVITLTGRITVQTLETQAYLERDVQSSQRTNMVFDRLISDLSRLLPGLPGEVTPLTVFGTPQQVLQLSALASSFEENAGLHDALRPATVRYRLAEKSDSDGSWSLTREVVHRTASGAVPARETIGEQLAELKIEVFTRGAWVTGFAPTESNVPTPSAVRVSLRWADQADAQTRTFLVFDAR
jgi:type II secretory pathway component PulJ